MTREFHIKGLPGLIIFVTATLATIAFLLVVPSLVFMVLWNAVIFEGLKGPAIQLAQGALLWAMAAIVLKVLLQPTLEVHFRKTTPEELAALKSYVETHRIPSEDEPLVLASNGEVLAEQPIETDFVKKR